MADNTTLNTGTGGDVIASDDIGGVKFQRVKLVHGADGVNDGDVSDTNGFPVLSQAEPIGPWPGYTAADSDAQRTLNVDDYGALVTRGAVVTDEGTFRVNFANTSLAVNIGSVNVAGNVVTGTGFTTADVHMNDYFKIAADADTAYVQIDSIVNDTTILLKSAYSGSASGTGNRSLLAPFVGSGGSLSVGSGALTLTGGTTATSITGVKRFTDYGPLVFRARVTVSQRIANQDIHIGLEEDVATPRWFARFRLNGTTNTTVICETGRNPSGAPSASETQSSTVTLPNGGTTAAARDYRVELLTESVRFYIDGVLVAEHTNIIPHQHDEMTSHVEIINGTTPASSTTVTVDYITGKNHNKLEVGIMSSAEGIVANQPPAQEFAYSQAGVITINTDLLIIDCSQLRGLSIQCTSMGTTGVVTAAFSNDGATWVNQTLMTSLGAAATTFNAAGLWTTPVVGRYFRLRLTTATTAGTTTLRVNGFQFLIGQPVAQPVSGTVALSANTPTLAAGTNLAGDVGMQVRANATGAMTTGKIASAATTNATLLKSSAGRVFGWQLTNTTAAVKVVRLYNLTTAPTVGTSVPVYNIVIPANGHVSFLSPIGIAHATGISYSITNAIADLDATAVAANDVIGAIYYA